MPPHVSHMPHGPDGDGEDPSEGLRDGAEVRRGFQGVHEDRLRPCPAEVELPRDPERIMKRGGYSWRVPKASWVSSRTLTGSVPLPPAA